MIALAILMNALFVVKNVENVLDVATPVSVTYAKSVVRGIVGIAGSVLIPLVEIVSAFALVVVGIIANVVKDVVNPGGYVIAQNIATIY